MDKRTTSDKIELMKKYLEVVDERLKAAEEKVSEQQTKVNEAEEQVTEAKEVLRLARLEVEKLEAHKVEWMKEAKKELRIAEEKAEDELGSTMFRGKHHKGSR